MTGIKTGVGSGVGSRVGTPNTPTPAFRQVTTTLPRQKLSPRLRPAKTFPLLSSSPPPNLHYSAYILPSSSFPPPPLMNEHVTSHEIINAGTRITNREMAILGTVEMLGLVTGAQIERVHFGNLAGRSRTVVRWRVLRRMTLARLLRVYPLRTGSHAYTLGPVGERLIRQRDGLSGTRPARPRSLPSLHLIRHSLAISELIVSVIADARAHGATVDAATEPACWWTPDAGPVIRPDAYLAITADAHTDHWWIEVDQATETVATVLRQLGAYAEFARYGNGGPGGVIPRVVVSVPTQARARAVSGALSRVGDHPQGLITVTIADAASRLLIDQATGTTRYTTKGE